jgi:hypothetical protein
MRSGAMPHFLAQSAIALRIWGMARSVLLSLSPSAHKVARVKLGRDIRDKPGLLSERY